MYLKEQDQKPDQDYGKDEDPDLPKMVLTQLGCDAGAWSILAGTGLGRRALAPSFRGKKCLTT